MCAGVGPAGRSLAPGGIQIIKGFIGPPRSCRQTGPRGQIYPGSIAADTRGEQTNQPPAGLPPLQCVRVCACRYNITFIFNYQAPWTVFKDGGKEERRATGGRKKKKPQRSDDLPLEPPYLRLYRCAGPEAQSASSQSVSSNVKKYIARACLC